MVLPGYALIEQGAQIHVATWPGGKGSRHELLSRAFASQGACYVICVGGLARPKDVPEEWRDFADDTWTGDSCIINPFGDVISGPGEGEEILLAAGSSDLIRKAKTYCDAGGHYSRPDVFSLHVNRTPARRAVYADGRAAGATGDQAMGPPEFMPDGEHRPANSRPVSRTTGQETRNRPPSGRR